MEIESSTSIGAGLSVAKSSSKMEFHLQKFQELPNVKCFSKGALLSDSSYKGVFRSIEA